MHNSLAFDYMVPARVGLPNSLGQQKSARTGHCVGTEFNTSNEELLGRELEPIPFWSASPYSQLSKMVISPAVEMVMLPQLCLAFVMAMILGGTTMEIFDSDSSSSDSDEDEPAVAGGGGDDNDDDNFDNNGGNNNNLAAYWVWQHEKLAQIQQHVDDELLSGFDQKSGRPNLIASAKQVLKDWNNGKLRYYTEPPEKFKCEKRKWYQL
uniref:SCP domain-containing protein n=1 Tax=Globodera pallida TaxID=36090 RepID=A0A183CP65_GLOPA